MGWDYFYTNFHVGLREFCLDSNIFSSLLLLKNIAYMYFRSSLAFSSDEISVSLINLTSIY
jgi:hypothetical protein